MPKKKADKPPEPVRPAKRPQRDFSQRGHDTVREVEKRHAERHQDEPKS